MIGRTYVWDTHGATAWEVARKFGLPAERQAQRLDPLRASAIIERSAADPLILPALLSLYEDLTGARPNPPSSAVLQRAILPCLRRAFENEVWLLVPVEPWTEPEGHATVVQTEAARTSKPSASPRRVLSEEDFSFVEFVLMDEQNKPVSGLAYEINLPDGRKAQGTSGADGTIRFDRIPHGDCWISFPGLDSSAVVSS